MKHLALFSMKDKSKRNKSVVCCNFPWLFKGKHLYLFQAKHLQTQTSEQILLDGFAHFLPPFSDSLDKERWRQFRQELQKGLGLKR